jgi:hypothetical protein
LKIDSQIDDYFSKRALLLSEAVRNGLVEAQSLSAWKADLDRWISMEAHTNEFGR